MTTFTGPDLSAAVAAVNRLMDDTCRILDDRGTRDAILDPTTLAMIDPEPPILYEGHCLVSHQTLQPDDLELGDAPVTQSLQPIKIPIDAAGPFAAGNRLVVLSSRRDSALAGTMFEVVHIPVHTFAVMRELRCRRLTPPVSLGVSR